MQPNQPQQQELQVKYDDATLKGAYANAMQVQFSRDEFLLDFMNLFPPAATLNARIIVSPGHMKRMAAVLANTVKQYEEAHGKIEAASSPENEMGFKTA